MRAPLLWLALAGVLLGFAERHLLLEVAVRFGITAAAVIVLLVVMWVAQLGIQWWVER